MTMLDLLLRPELVTQAWDYFRTVQTKDQKYQPLLRPGDKPAIELNKGVMDRYRPEMRKYYYDPDPLQDLPGAAGDCVSDGEEVETGSRLRATRRLRVRPSVKSSKLSRRCTQSIGSATRVPSPRIPARPRKLRSPDASVSSARAWDARFPAAGRAPPRIRHRCRRRRLPRLRLPAAGDAGAREHRDADGQVRRRRQQAHFQGAAPRRARVVWRNRPGAALRPHGAARPRRRRASREAAAVLQALPDPAGVAGGPAGARAVSRVLSVRRRRHRLAIDGRRDRAVRRGRRRAAAARFPGLRDPAERPPHPVGPARRGRRARRSPRAGARRARQDGQDRPRRRAPGAAGARHRG